jgi:hypothetical protein
LSAARPAIPLIWLAKTTLGGRSLRALPERFLGGKMSHLSPAAQRIVDTAKQRIVELAQYFWGPPKSRDRRGRWRWPEGREVSTAGRWAGRFQNWASGEGGDGIELVQTEATLDFAGALRFVADFFGLPLTDKLSREERQRIEEERRRRQRQAAEKTVNEAAAAIDQARGIVARTVPIGGTLGEVYLTRTRSIPKPAEGWRDEFPIRWLPPDAGDRSSGGAVVGVATDDGGEVRAAHCIYLDAFGGNVTWPHNGKRRKKKLTYGRLAGAVVRLPGPPDAPLLHAEGLETGLSAWRATGYQTWIWLGGLARAQP